MNYSDESIRRWLSKRTGMKINHLSMHSIDCLPCSDKQYGIEMDVPAHQLTYDRVCLLSKLLKTKRIDMNPNIKDGCPMCKRGFDPFIEIHIDRVTLPDEQEIT